MLGVVGFCMGGSLALWSATVAENIQAAVGFYPAMPWERMSPTWPTTHGKAAMIHCSEEDGTSAAPGIQAAVEGDRGRRRHVEVFDYPGTHHAFFNDDRPEVHDPKRLGAGLGPHRRLPARAPREVPDPARLPHPATGQLFASPVPPGTGWPGDPSAPGTPVARDPGRRPRLARAAPGLRTLEARVGSAAPARGSWPGARRSPSRSGGRSRASRTGAAPIPGWGDDRAWLLIVGLAPAAHGGNRTGRIFTGDRSGDWIFAALHRAGLADPGAQRARRRTGSALVGARMAAPVRCAPPANKPLPVERDTCAPWFDRELSCSRPPAGPARAGRVRLGRAPGGRAPQGWAVPVRARASRTAPRCAAAPGGPPVTLLATYHVSQQNTFTGRLTEPMLDDVLARARALAG